MQIVELNDLARLEECTQVQQKVWGLSEQDIVPTHLMKAFADPEDTWGILLGACIGNKMVGISLSFPTSRSDTYLLHMLGVLPSFRNQEIGHNLIRATKEIAAARGVAKIVLTYDPLESINAGLYLNKHRGICTGYVIDYYRVYGSKTHSGFPADRFKVEIFVREQDRDSATSTSAERLTAVIEIPANFQQLKDSSLQNAVDWRNRTRPLFSKHINEEGYIVTGFEWDRIGQTGKYLLEQPRTR